MSGFRRGDLTDIAALLRSAAGAEIMPRFRRLEAGDIRQKSGPLDLVTEADEAAERVITAGLRTRFPGCLVVGEEAAERDPALLGQLMAADLSFVVDPVDGTANFAAGMPLFGCMVAAMLRGEIVGSVIHDPVLDSFVFALRGEGAWSEEADGGGGDLRVAAAVPLARMTGAASWRFLPSALGAVVMRNLDRVAASFSWRCAAHEYRLLASGGCHYLLFGRLMPWDHAPGWLLHREAGGYAAMFDGSAYGVDRLTGGLLLAPDVGSWEELRVGLLNG